MAKVTTSDIRNGLTIRLNDDLYTIQEFQHVKPGKGAAFVRTKIKGVVNGKTIDKNFRTGEKLEAIRVERRSYQFLFREGNLRHFMDLDTYEQIPLEKSKVKKDEYMQDGETVTLVIDAEKEEVLYAEPPDHVEQEVVDTEPGIRGDTAQGGSKPAQIDSGATVQVPLFINQGDVIRVDTRTGEYLERVKTG